MQALGSQVESLVMVAMVEVMLLTISYPASKTAACNNNRGCGTCMWIHGAAATAAMS